MGLLDGILGGVGDIGSTVAGIIGGNSANSDLQAGIKQARGDINSAYSTAQGYQQPLLQTGMQNLNTLNQNVNNGAYNTSPYSYQTNQFNQSQPTGMDNYGTQPGQYQQGQFNFQQQPGYQFQLQQGQQAINNSAAAQGNVLSGGTQKALASYSTGLANQSYNTAYNQYVQGQQLGAGIQNQAYNQFGQNRDFSMNAYQQQLNQYNQNRNANLQQNQQGMQNAQNTYQDANQQAMQQYQMQNGLANLGVNASNNLGNMAIGQGNDLSNLTLQGAQANAANDMNTAKAVGSGLNNLGQLGMFDSMMGGSMFGNGTNWESNSNPYRTAYNNTMNYNTSGNGN